MTRTAWILIGLGALIVLLSLRTTRPPVGDQLASKGPARRAPIKAAPVRVPEVTQYPSGTTTTFD